jgi:hypothetical protein
MNHNIPTIRAAIAGQYPRLARIFASTDEEVQGMVNILIDTGYNVQVEKTLGILLDKDSSLNYENIPSLGRAVNMVSSEISSPSAANDYSSTKIVLKKIAIFFSWLIISSVQNNS